MKNVGEVHFRVIDNGLFVPIARRLARQARKVTYWSPHQRAFNSVVDLVGEGFEEIEWVDCYLEDKPDVDCWVFPDIGYAGLQKDLLDQRRVVWGSGDADKLEISRGRFLEALVDIGLPVPPYRKIVGMGALRDYLKDKSDKYIKISQFRLDWETLHWRDWEQDEFELDVRAVRLGPFKELINFYVFDQIEAKLEDGLDTICIDGKIPSLVIHGVEAKDKAYLGTFQQYADLPEELRSVSDAFAPVLGRDGYRNFFSTEVRITEEKESYFIDPTLRAGSPPSQVMCEMISNYAEIIWGGANGQLIEPVPAASFGVQGLLTAEGGHKDWSVTRIPKEIDQWVKCGMCDRFEDALAFPPNPNASGEDIGWLVGIGDTPQGAIDHLKENVGKLPPGVSCDYFGLIDLLKEVEEAEKAGMEFTEQQMPEPEAIVKNGG